MFTPEEYKKYNEVIDYVLQCYEHKNNIHSSKGQREHTDCIYFYDSLGSGTYLLSCKNINILPRAYLNINIDIDIFENEIKFLDYSKDHNWEIFNTEEFTDNSDEEFFQLSTIIDCSIMEETFLRKLIKLSIILRGDNV